MTQHSRPVRPFTGRHMAVILVAFFGVVIAVNVMMARLATSTFGGVVVENSYVASQQFNGWLHEARNEKALGWSAVAGRAGDAVEVSIRDSGGRPLAAAHVTGKAEHPLGRRPEIALAFAEVEPGRYTARLEPGRWRLHLEIESDGRVWRTIEDVQ